MEFLLTIIFTLTAIVISPLIVRSITRGLTRLVNNIHDLREHDGVPLGLSDGKQVIIGNLPVPKRSDCIDYDTMTPEVKHQYGLFKPGSREYNALMRQIERHE